MNNYSPLPGQKAPRTRRAQRKPKVIKEEDRLLKEIIGAAIFAESAKLAIGSLAKKSAGPSFSN
jgi:hypothetical protein